MYCLNDSSTFISMNTPFNLSSPDKFETCMVSLSAARIYYSKKLISLNLIDEKFSFISCYKMTKKRLM